MSDLTLAQRFGNTIIFAPTTKKLTIDLNDLSSIEIAGVNYGLDVSAMNDTNKDKYATRILWALLLLSRSNQPVDNNDETIGLYITNQGKRSVTRNQVSQFGFQLVATAYQNDTIGTNLDPDSIGA